MPGKVRRCKAPTVAALLGLMVGLLAWQPAANASLAQPQAQAVFWQVVLTPDPCTYFAAGSCSPFTAMSGSFGLRGSIHGALLSPLEVFVEGESQQKDHKGEASLFDGETLSFSLKGTYTPPAAPSPVPIPYPLVAYAEGSPPTGNVPPDVPPWIELGSLALPDLGTRRFSGALYAFDAPVRVGSWEVVVSSSAIPEPATLALVALALAGMGWVRRAR